MNNGAGYAGIGCERTPRLSSKRRLVLLNRLLAGVIMSSRKRESMSRLAVTRLAEVQKIKSRNERSCGCGSCGAPRTLYEESSTLGEDPCSVHEAVPAPMAAPAFQVALIKIFFFFLFFWMVPLTLGHPTRRPSAQGSRRTLLHIRARGWETALRWPQPCFRPWTPPAALTPPEGRPRGLCSTARV